MLSWSFAHVHMTHCPCPTFPKTEQNNWERQGDRLTTITMLSIVHRLIKHVLFLANIASRGDAKHERVTPPFPFTKWWNIVIRKTWRFFWTKTWPCTWQCVINNVPYCPCWEMTWSDARNEWNHNGLWSMCVCVCVCVGGGLEDDIRLCFVQILIGYLIIWMCKGTHILSSTMHYP